MTVARTICLGFIAVILLGTILLTMPFSTGNGNWNESSHWSFSSGGNGGAGIPSSNDDVYFDSNSFQSTKTSNVPLNLERGKSALLVYLFN